MTLFILSRIQACLQDAGKALEVHGHCSADLSAARGSEELRVGIKYCCLLRFRELRLTVMD